MSSSIKLYKALSLFYEEYIQPFDVNAYLVIVAIFTIIYLGWLSTELQNIQSVWIWETPRSRRNNSVLVGIFNTRPRSQTQSRGTVTTDGGSPNQELEGTQSSSVTEETAALDPVLETVEQTYNDTYTANEEHRVQTQMTLNNLQENIDHLIGETIQDPVPQQIIREMDRDDMELRYRPSTSAQARSLEADNSASVENCSNENSENEQISKTRSKTDTIATTDSDNTEFTVKLKYLNDDVKIVKAKPNEILKDFKS